MLGTHCILAHGYNAVFRILRNYIKYKIPTGKWHSEKRLTGVLLPDLVTFTLQ
jgi:hypothetical protein